MRLFSRIKGPGIIIFKDRTVLTSLYLLKDKGVIDREKEIDAIADYIKRVLTGRCAKFLSIYGSSGLGKTAITRYALSKLLSEGIEQALPIYIVYIDRRTKHSILTELMCFFRAFY